MVSALTTTYLGHDIRIEPFEWGYLAEVVEPRSNKRFVAANASAFKALEEAFNVIDEALNDCRPTLGSGRDRRSLIKGRLAPG